MIVGAVLDELAAQHLEERTVVFFSGDNGADDHSLQIFDDVGPFRGRKRSLHEGDPPPHARILIVDPPACSYLDS